MKLIQHLINLLTVCKIALVTTFSAALLWSCGEKKQDASESGLSGRYVNNTFLQSIPDSIPGLVPAFCYELNFISEDSVNVFFGFEEATLAYKKQGNHYLIMKAMQDKDMTLQVNEDQTLSLLDTAWTSRNTPSEFKKVAMVSGQKWEFENYLNQQMIAGSYTVYQQDQPTDQKISFKADGTVTGIGDYISYSICYSGDCVGEVYPASNSMTLTNAKKESVTYAFVKSKGSNKISVYHIEAPIPDMKGERAIKELAYDLRK